MRMRDGMGRIDPKARIYDNVTLGKNVTVREGAILYENVSIGDNSYIGPNVTVGEPLPEFYSGADYENPPTVIGPDSLVRSGTIIYCGTTTGSRFRTGHMASFREFTEIGEDCSFGGFCLIDGRTKFGDGCRLHYNVATAQGTIIGNRVVIYPYSCFPDSLHPPCRRHRQAPVIGDETVILIHSVILPRVKVGSRCLVAAYTVVAEDVPDGMSVMGIPGKIKRPAAEIPCKITPGHHPYPWVEAEK